MKKADIARKLKSLKNLLETCRDFSVTWAYFDKHFGLNLEFFALGKPGLDANLLKAFQAAIQKLFSEKESQMVVVPKTLKYKEHHFVHGACQVNQSECVAFYFNDIGKGLCAVNMGDSVVFCLFIIADSGEDYDLKFMDEPFSQN